MLCWWWSCWLRTWSVVDAIVMDIKASEQVNRCSIYRNNSKKILNTFLSASLSLSLLSFFNYFSSETVPSRVLFRNLKWSLMILFVLYKWTNAFVFIEIKIHVEMFKRFPRDLLLLLCVLAQQDLFCPLLHLLNNITWLFFKPDQQSNCFTEQTDERIRHALFSTDKHERSITIRQKEREKQQRWIEIAEPEMTGRHEWILIDTTDVF